MGQKQQQPNPDPLPEPKKRRRVGFSNIGLPTLFRFFIFCFHFFTRNAFPISIFTSPLFAVISIFIIFRSVFCDSAHCCSFSCSTDAGVEANDCTKIYLGEFHFFCFKIKFFFSYFPIIYLSCHWY